MSERFKSAAAWIRECYRRAAEARRLGAAATDPSEKADFLEVEQGWLSLARRYERGYELEDPSKNGKGPKNR